MIIQNSTYDHAETNEEMYGKIKEINEKAEVVAQRTPLCLGQEEDEMKQICFFILRYYDPILSQLERQELQSIMKGSVDEITQEERLVISEREE